MKTALLTVLFRNASKFDVETVKPHNAALVLTIVRAMTAVSQYENSVLLIFTIVQLLPVCGECYYMCLVPFSVV